MPVVQRAFAVVVRYVFEQPCTKRINLCLSLGNLFGRIATCELRPRDFLATLYQIAPDVLQPVAQSHRRDAIVPVVALNDSPHFLGHFGATARFQQPLHPVAVVVRLPQLDIAP